MSPSPRGSGSNIRSRSIWGNSAATRPRLSQTPRRMPSISLADFSGKAAARLARPIRCSLSFGPSRRINRPPRSAICLRLVVRIARSMTAANDPSVASTPALTCLCTRWASVLERGMRACGSSSKRDENLSEHLTAFHPRQCALEVGERNLHIDYRQQTFCHLGETLADVAHGGAERTNDAILLLEKLHQVERR